MAGGALAMKKLMLSDSDRVDVDEGDSSDTELERPVKSIQYLKWIDYHTFCFPLINGLKSLKSLTYLVLIHFLSLPLCILITIIFCLIAFMTCS